MPTNATQVVYTGIGLPYIGVTTNQTLDVILTEVNTAFNSVLPAPNYGPYNLGPYHGISITQTDGISHPTNTQNFAEGISKIVCNNQYTVDTFIGTTYVSDQSVITAAITALQIPGITYSPFSITGTDTITQVLNKNFTGIGTILTAINPSSGNWSVLSITPPTTITTGFNSLIAYIHNMDNTIATKQNIIPTLDNSANILTSSGGTAADSIRTTTELIITYVTTLPTYSSSGYTWGCVTSGVKLDDTLQNIINAITSLGASTVQGYSTGLTLASSSSCGGKIIEVDPTWTGLYKVMLSSGDTYTNADYLDNKLISLDGSINFNINNHKLNLQVATPVTNKVIVNSSDTVPGFLAGKIPSTQGTFGLTNIVTASADNSSLNIAPTITNPQAFIGSLLRIISSDPILLAQFCALNEQCAGCTCTAPSSLALSSKHPFVLTWSVGGSPTSQLVKYRQRGSADWITDNNITPKNPETNIATTASVANLDDNTVYQFQVDSVCSGTTNGTSVVETIAYACQGFTVAVHVAGTISGYQSAFSTIDTIQYRLKNSSAVVVGSAIATGINPTVTFTNASIGGTISSAGSPYTIEWRMGTLVNGVTLYSDDSSQLSAWCVSGSITIA